MTILEVLSSFNKEEAIEFYEKLYNGYKSLNYKHLENKYNAYQKRLKKLDELIDFIKKFNTLNNVPYDFMYENITKSKWPEELEVTSENALKLISRTIDELHIKCYVLTTLQECEIIIE